MGLLSLFGKGKKGSEPTAQTTRGGTADAQASKSGQGLASGAPSQNLITHVEQCFHMNARCIGSCAVVGMSLDSAGRMPGFTSFLGEMSSILSGSLDRLMKTESGKRAAWLVPNNYSQYVSHQPTLTTPTYYLDMGLYALTDTNGGRPNHSIDGMFNCLDKTASAAIASSLALLRVAMEESANDITDMMLKDPSYMLALSAYYLYLQVNVNHIYNANSVVFLPDTSVNPGKSDDFELRHYDYGGMGHRMVPIPSALKLMFVENRDGRVALGHGHLGGSNGPTGYYCSTGNDPNAPQLIEKIADNFVKGIHY